MAKFMTLEDSINNGLLVAVRRLLHWQIFYQREQFWDTKSRSTHTFIQIKST